ncbi:hypothetical protein [Natronorubrum halophilum]|uniref:hypothetical protein n=1 Tax=Natronorubrum halophilum TaxID=1702106 RepID=UPI001EE973C0|nr:hypothetical protein [Natronorubrum halophilum]
MASKALVWGFVFLMLGLGMGWPGLLLFIVLVVALEGYVFPKLGAWAENATSTDPGMETDTKSISASDDANKDSTLVAEQMNTRHLGADQTPRSSSSSEPTSGPSDHKQLDYHVLEDNTGKGAPFEWYGDTEVTVEEVLAHIDADPDLDTREYIKLGVEKHRNTGAAVDAADIRWVAEEAEEMDLEGEHPFPDK